MKSCSKCGKSLTLESFSWRNKAKGQRQSQCKLCAASGVAARRENPEYRDRGRTMLARWKRLQRLEALQKLGGVCVCCGETNSKLLTFDHVNDDGNIHRLVHDSANTVVKAVLRGGDGYDLRVLCWNCNSGRSYNGGICPHNLEALTVDQELDRLSKEHRESMRRNR